MARRRTPSRALAALAATAAISALAAATPAIAQTQATGTITTVAGGPGGPAPAKRLALLPCGVTANISGLYLADGGTLAKVSPASATLTTVAGTGSLPGPAGNGGLAAKASLAGACGAVTDSAGNVLIADSQNNQVQVVAARSGSFYGQNMTAKHIYLLAGNGTGGFSGDGGPAAQAGLDLPLGVAIDSAGNVLIADAGNDRVRVVAEATGTYYGQSMTAGSIYTVAGDGGSGFTGDGGPATAAELNAPGQVAVTPAGDVLIADAGNNRIRLLATTAGTAYGQTVTSGDLYTVAGNGATTFSGDGGPATAAGLSAPGAGVDSNGNLLIADAGHDRIRVVAQATGSYYGQAMTAGSIYTVAGDGQVGISGDGGPATAARLDYPAAVTADGAGNLIVADQGNARVQLIAAATGTQYRENMTAGHVYTVAGATAHEWCCQAKPATAAQFSEVSTVAADAAGTFAPAGDGVQFVPGGSGTYFGRAMTGGDAYTVAGVDGKPGFTGDGGLATGAKLAAGSLGVAVDANGNLLIADTGNNRVRVVPVTSGTFYHQAMTAGHIYGVAGDGQAGFSGDGGRATSAQLSGPTAVTTDAAGNVVIDDSAVNNRIRVVATATGTFYGQKMKSGNIYTVAGQSTGGDNGDGGPATSAMINAGTGVATDSHGNLLIADTENNRVRVVAAKAGTFYSQKMKAGYMYTVAGGVGQGFSGDGKRATQASLSQPGGVAIDGAGNLLIADTLDNRIRVVAAQAGTYYGLTMKAGYIYTVAGDGEDGFAGDGAAAVKAKLGSPSAVAASGSDVLIADSANNRVRELTPAG